MRADKLEQRIPFDQVHVALAWRDVARIGGFVAILAAALMISDTRFDFALSGWMEWSCAIAACAVGFLLFQFSRLALIWLSLQTTKTLHSGPANSLRKNAQDRGLIELFGYFSFSLCSLTLVAYLSTAPNIFGANSVHLAISSPNDALDSVHVAIFVSAFLLSFAPLLAGFLLMASAEVRARSVPLFRDDAISPMTLLIACASAGSIIALAWAAEGQLFSMSRDFGVIITLLVICGFLVTILAPHVARYWNNRTEARQELLRGVHKAGLPFVSPAKFVSWIDSGLVRLVAPLSGATQRGPGVPHMLLIAVMLPLCALGFVLASPYGLIPIGAGMLIALSLGRRWAWVEEDRETASRLQSTRGREIQIGFDNDLKDEALLGYASFFILVPLALNQLQDWTGSFKVVEQASTGNAFFDWLRFFGAELAKAVPFVDWWEIYNVKVDTPFDAENAAPLAKHLTFAARALVDLVIMSALLQAFGMWQRGRTQQKLYDSGQLDSFDPFTETAFFETGMQSGGKQPMPKKSFERRIDVHFSNQKQLGLTAVPYSQRRLSELIGSDNRDVRAGAEWMVEKYGILAGPPRAQLQQLRARWINLRLGRGGQLWTTEETSSLRAEKVEFERVLIALGDDISELNDASAGILVGLLVETRGAPEFSYAQLLAYELLGRLKTRFAMLALALHVLKPDIHFEARPEWREDLKFEMGYPLPNLFLSHADDRKRIYGALLAIGTSQDADLSAREGSLALLTWLGQSEGGDKADAARAYAALCSLKVRKSLSEHNSDES